MKTHKFQCDGCKEMKEHASVHLPSGWFPYQVQAGGANTFTTKGEVCSRKCLPKAFEYGAMEIIRAADKIRHQSGTIEHNYDTAGD